MVVTAMAGKGGTVLPASGRFPGNDPTIGLETNKCGFNAG